MDWSIRCFFAVNTLRAIADNVPSFLPHRARRSLVRLRNWPRRNNVGSSLHLRWKSSALLSLVLNDSNTNWVLAAVARLVRRSLTRGPSNQSRRNVVWIERTPHPKEVSTISRHVRDRVRRRSHQSTVTYERRIRPRVTVTSNFEIQTGGVGRIRSINFDLRPRFATGSSDAVSSLRRGIASRVLFVSSDSGS